MENRASFIEPLFQKAEQYGKTTLEIIKLKTIDKTASYVSTMVSRMFVILCAFMFLLVVNIGLSLWIGDLLGKVWYGFYCVAAFYAVLGLVLYFFFHESIKRRVSKSILIQALN